jgi:DNA-binding MarR family transcriptional regulator
MDTRRSPPMKRCFTQEDIAEVDRLHHLMHRKMAKAPYESHYPRLAGLSSIEMSVLRILSDDPEAMPTGIAKEIGVSKSTLTSAINRLEARVYIERQISPADKRSFRLALTEEGKLAQGEHLSSEKEFYTKLLGLMGSKEETATFLRLAAKIVEGF